MTSLGWTLLTIGGLLLNAAFFYKMPLAAIVAGCLYGLAIYISR